MTVSTYGLEQKTYQQLKDLARSKGVPLADVLKAAANEYAARNENKAINIFEIEPKKAQEQFRVTIDAEVSRQIKLLAKVRGVRCHVVAEEALREYLKKSKNQKELKKGRKQGAK